MEENGSVEVKPCPPITELVNSKTRTRKIQMRKIKTYNRRGWYQEYTKKYIKDSYT